MASESRVKFVGLRPSAARDKTPTGKPRYIFYVYDIQGKSMNREVHANNLSAASGAALRSVFKGPYKAGKRFSFLISDTKYSNGTSKTRKFAKAVWTGTFTSAQYPVFEPFKLVSKSGLASRKSSNRKSASKRKSTSKTSRSRKTSRSKSKSKRKSTRK